MFTIEDSIIDGILKCIRLHHALMAVGAKLDEAVRIPCTFIVFFLKAGAVMVATP